MNKPAKYKEGTIGEILDHESGKFIDITADMQRTASFVHQQILMGAFISAVSIKKMFDDKLYLGMNCTSRDEYIDTMLPFGRSQAYKLYKVASKFNAVSQSLTGNGLTQISSSETLEIVQSTALNGKAAEISSLGIEKLYELTKLDDDDIKDLIKKGKVKLEDGDITIEDIKDATAKELSRIVKEQTKKYRDENSKLREEVELIKAEKQTAEKKLAKLENRKEELDEIESKYGAVASLTADKKDHLKRSNDLLNDFIETFVRAGITADDPESLRKDCQDLIRKIDEIHQRALAVYDTVIVD